MMHGGYVVIFVLGDVVKSSSRALPPSQARVAATVGGEQRRGVV